MAKVCHIVIFLLSRDTQYLDMGKLQFHRYEALLFLVIAVCFHRVFSYLEDDLAGNEACFGEGTLDGGVDV